jgi:hypothetical protein
MLVGPTHEICQVGPIASKMTSGAELTRDEDINLATTYNIISIFTFLQHTNAITS